MAPGRGGRRGRAGADAVPPAVDEQRSPHTRAAVNELLDSHLDMLDESKLDSYETFVRNHIRPLICELQLARIDGKVLDSFYKQLRTCRAHCRGQAFVEHRIAGAHECTERCQPHRPLPAAPSAGPRVAAKIHAILTGAGKRAVRWGWVGRNPVEQAESIAAVRPHRQPPTAAEQAAVIVTEAWADPDWGMFVWLAMTTGARRGELCALRWDRVDLGSGMLTIRTNVRQRGAGESRATMAARSS
jgi:integrase